MLTVGFIMGSVTPPVGVCYFTAAAIAGEKIDRVARALLPFLLVEVFAMFIMLVFSPLTLALPGLLGFIRG